MYGDTSFRQLNETDCFTFHLLARFPTKWQHIGTYACWIDCPIDHKVRTRSTGEIFVRMTKYIAPRMLDVHGRSIIEWHVIDSPNVRWNEVHRFGCVIRLHVNLYMAYCRKNISRPCWREIYLISKSNTNTFLLTQTIFHEKITRYGLYSIDYTLFRYFFFVKSTKARSGIYKQK